MVSFLYHHLVVLVFFAGEIRSSVDLDREAVPGYHFFAQATDGGGRWCRARVKLIITDVNDNPPIFSLEHYTVSVYEDTSPKALLTCIKAIDPDEGRCKIYKQRTTMVLLVLTRLFLETLQCVFLLLLFIICPYVSGLFRSRSDGDVLPE